MENRNIFLIGFMGVGKSTIARILAKELDAELIEMDETIEAEAGTSINEIFAQYGEQHFRDLESALVERIAHKGGAIVSCGGGAVLREQNVASMKASGRIIFLSATPETIYERVRFSTTRPLLKDNMNVEHIAQLMEKRASVYANAADVTIVTDGKDKNAIVREIMGIE